MPSTADRLSHARDLLIDSLHTTPAEEAALRHFIEWLGAITPQDLRAKHILYTSNKPRVVDDTPRARFQRLRLSVEPVRPDTEDALDRAMADFVWANIEVLRIWCDGILRREQARLDEAARGFFEAAVIKPLTEAVLSELIARARPPQKPDAPAPVLIRTANAAYPGAVVLDPRVT